MNVLEEVMSEFNQTMEEAALALYHYRFPDPLLYVRTHSQYDCALTWVVEVEY